MFYKWNSPAKIKNKHQEITFLQTLILKYMLIF